ncbi:reverse transcriptase domain-containing protein [Tanacetum coccineum]
MEDELVGADRSFMPTAFSSLIDITPTALDVKCTIELANGKLIGADTIIRGCTLNLLNHPFNINLMPVELRSFDVIIGMDWFSTYHAVIVCDEKLVRIPFANETLTIQGDSCANSEDSIKEVVTETMIKQSLQEYMEEVQADYGSNTTTPRFDENAKFELGDEFLKYYGITLSTK